ncbi:TIGR03862 family flavoprotein [Pseudoxanthomonas koreensis]|uniref:TIGR03862 family flavoprotein n=1 Tax=Pseudoxanthomonas koreensis TaxID=266061 RepID=UPI001391DBD8|nr:TIGR03862 family flavoprotein [Pseudoxanthomonas koreensis]KAF1693382.1 aminoacetone oxidase family FAD-binding enzyme [Pseudoxanthomonas koreensis]
MANASTPPPAHLPGLAVVGGGPAALMAAEVARAAGVEVGLFEATGSGGRKFLIAGKGGLNLTHAEPMPGFARRYGTREAEVGGWLHDFGPEALRQWARGLGVDTYIGSSDRVFPLDRKAAPLLRGWVRRLKEQGVRFHVQHRWLGWDDAGALRFDTPEGERRLHAGATVLALGGGSWPQLGSDGTWVAALQARGIDVADLQPSNCGFDIGWSAHFAERHAGAPLKPVVAHWRDADGREHALQGECVATATGIEGSLVYALSVPLRDAIARDGTTTLWLDLMPGRDLPRLQRDLARPRNGRSLAEHLRRHAGVEGVKAALLREVLDAPALADMDRVAATLKRLPLRLLRPRPLAEAISSGGGVRLEALDDATLMASAVPGTFCAGEMLDWEAPTGGYLLTACFASGRRAGRAAADWLHRNAG